MQWLRYLRDGKVMTGVLEQQTVHEHGGALFEAFAPTGNTVVADGLQWLPPCVPGKIIGLWNNFRAAAEKNGWSAPTEPLYFMKSPGAAAGHQQAIAVPSSYPGRVVFEGELVLVMGTTARQVTVQDAPQHIFGYTCGNDVTALELIHRDASFPQWTRAKSFDGFAAFGPVIDTAFDAANGHLRTLVDGRERQNYAFSDMFFSPAQIVSHLSHDMTLEPGDLIYCGTSLGVLPIKAGATVEVLIDGIGTLSNRYG
ncbi:2-hydroxyhepta-2,4-diene-1,7-dioate isomerase [Limnohabitans sp. 2KL-51]|nr:2-hydroxyhepta-2,4-diene-1,7-dioate isomerase [Limnohabitans sp. 2KL-51]